jgi:hypothetical protein
MERKVSNVKEGGGALMCWCLTIIAAIFAFAHSFEGTSTRGSMHLVHHRYNWREGLPHHSRDEQSGNRNRTRHRCRLLSNAASRHGGIDLTQLRKCVEEGLALCLRWCCKDHGLWCSPMGEAQQQCDSRAWSSSGCR